MWFLTSKLQLSHPFTYHISSDKSCFRKLPVSPKKYTTSFFKSNKRTGVIFYMHTIDCSKHISKAIPYQSFGKMLWNIWYFNPKKYNYNVLDYLEKGMKKIKLFWLAKPSRTLSSLTSLLSIKKKPKLQQQQKNPKWKQKKIISPKHHKEHSTLQGRQIIPS